MGAREKNKDKVSSHVGQKKKGVSAYAHVDMRKMPDQISSGAWVHNCMEERWNAIGILCTRGGCRLI